MRMHLKYRKDGSILYGIGWTNRWMYALFSLHGSAASNRRQCGVIF